MSLFFSKTGSDEGNTFALICREAANQGKSVTFI